MSHEYIANGRTIPLELHSDHLAVRYREGVSRPARAAAAASAGLGPWDRRIELPGERFTLHPVAHVARPRHERHAAAMERTAAHTDVHRVAPVFRHGRVLAVATDRITVGLDAGGNIDAALAAIGAEVVECHPDRLVVRLDPGRDALEACAGMRATPGARYAEPDFVTIGHTSPRRSAGSGNGGGTGRQYALGSTAARQAWDVQPGDPKIRIAILDEGVQSAHPDLAAAMAASHDACGQAATGDPEPWDAHGTACAGLAAGVGDGETGVRGIATGCSLVCVRIGYTPTEAGAFVTRNEWIAGGIDWAWQNGADVLSNSWGGVLESSSITDALERARTQGRGGKGCVIVVAAGNEEVFQGRIDFPGTLPDVLTVAASNEYDEPKTTKSADNERWWGSSYGPEIDLAAPGVDNYTTDNLGAPGFTKEDHVPDFNGTSSATPIVAAAAALVLAANGGLREEEVRSILTDTADKVGSIPYVEGRNDH
ncbi:MAG TPA: S8 family serine peptidase, partial [Gemmatimonadota bacterium]|nr:S8 family serine peptidase [Gemmatimonadota bacterium]